MFEIIAMAIILIAAGAGVIGGVASIIATFVQLISEMW